MENTTQIEQRNKELMLKEFELRGQLRKALKNFNKTSCKDDFDLWKHYRNQKQQLENEILITIEQEEEIQIIFLQDVIDVLELCNHRHNLEINAPLAFEFLEKLKEASKKQKSENNDILIK